MHAEGDLDLDTEELAEQREIVREFRLLHGRPLQTVASNLRYYVDEKSDLMIIGKRLKRVPTIIDKLNSTPRDGSRPNARHRRMPGGLGE
jgi:hypothetical protein